MVHKSLGHSTIYQKSSLLVNLDYEPDQIFIRVTIAEWRLTFLWRTQRQKGVFKVPQAGHWL